MWGQLEEEILKPSKQTETNGYKKGLRIALYILISGLSIFIYNSVTGHLAETSETKAALIATDAIFIEIKTDVKQLNNRLARIETMIDNYLAVSKLKPRP